MFQVSKASFLLLLSVYSFSVGFDDVLHTDSTEYEADSPHHRSRRAVVDAADIQPTYEFPLVLFTCDDFNTNVNCTDGSYFYQRPNEYRVWAKTNGDQQQEHTFRSFRIMPNHTVTFKACCSSGNTFTKTVHDPGNVNSIHYWMFNNSDVAGSSGIWYTDWLHFEQEFSIKVHTCTHPTCKPLNCSCFFGTCGLDNKCHCASGYSGTHCETRPSDTERYPTQEFPLILFPDVDFEGTPKKVKANSYETFAQNRKYARTMIYQSLRLLYTWPIIFARDNLHPYKVSPGTDIANLNTYLSSNTNVAKTIWYSYAQTMDVDFQVKVESVAACANCDKVGGCCYSGTCKCLTGYTGTNCSSAP